MVTEREMVVMSQEKTEKDKFKDHALRELDRVIERERDRVRVEERLFHIQTGARVAIENLYHLGLLNEIGEDLIGTWVKAGGNSRVEFNGVAIWPQL